MTCVVNTPNWHCEMWILFSCLSLGCSFGRHLLVAILWCHCNSKVKWPMWNPHGLLQELSVRFLGVFVLVLKVHCFGIVRQYVASYKKALCIFRPTWHLKFPICTFGLSIILISTVSMCLVSTQSWL